MRVPVQDRVDVPGRVGLSDVNCTFTDATGSVFLRIHGPWAVFSDRDVIYEKFALLNLHLSTRTTLGRRKFLPPVTNERTAWVEVASVPADPCTSCRPVDQGEESIPGRW